jgi:hypothetical protein
MPLCSHYAIGSDGSPLMTDDMAELREIWQTAENPVCATLVHSRWPGCKSDASGKR